MPLLDDLAEYLADATAMTVHEAVLLMSSEEGVPRLRLFTEGVHVHGFFRSPAGLFMCDMHNEGTDPFFSEIAQGNVEVDELVRLDATQDFIVEANWPTKKVLLDGEYYALPRNFARPFHEIVSHAQQKRKRR